MQVKVKYYRNYKNFGKDKFEKSYCRSYQTSSSEKNAQKQLSRGFPVIPKHYNCHVSPRQKLMYVEIFYRL